MPLPTLIRANLDRLVDEWCAYAADHIAPAKVLTRDELKNSSKELFTAIADDMATAETAAQQIQKSHGECAGNSRALIDYAKSHANHRAGQGFSLPDMASEFRAVRASVMRLCGDRAEYGPIPIAQVVRFNESLDEAWTVSLGWFDARLNQSRELFMGVLGHDMRGPLNAMLIGTEVLVMDDMLSPTSAQVSARLFSTGKRLNAMLDDLLDFTSTRLGKVLPISLEDGDMAETVRHVVNELRTRHPSVQLTYKTSGELHGRWDFARIAQVVSNLGGNAIQHGDNARPVTIQLDGQADDIVLTVHNEGTPITSQALSRIFDPLTRGDIQEHHDLRGSIGLGLYICREIALSHDGSIGVTSDQGGTTFVVRIARTVSDHPAVAPH
jgi:signal transduction histidine kinase